jgi:hypothetical protein
MSETQPPPWRAPPAARARVLSCPSCGGSVTVRANGISITAICSSCGSTLDVSNPDVRLIEAARRRTHQPPIAIGMRGSLVGTLWEVAGYQTRADTANGWSWDEYLLFNPYRGFRFLVQDDDDWVLYCMLRQDVPDPTQGFEGRRYTERGTGIARTTYVLGEFYWRARVGDEVSTADYIDSPWLLSREQNGDEIIWSRGIQLDGDTVGTAFGLQSDVVTGTTAKAASRGAHGRDVVWAGVIAVTLLLLLHMIPFGRFHSDVVFWRTFHTTSADEGRTLTTEVFNIPGKGGNLRIDAQSPVYNNWVELGVSLVGPNDITFNATPSISYYYGQDSDGSWSEGSQSTDVTFRSVPGGDYRMLIEPYAGGYRVNPDNPNALKTNTPVDFTVIVTRHVASWGNFWIALLLLIPYPIFRFFFPGSGPKPDNGSYPASTWKPPS